MRIQFIKLLQDDFNYSFIYLSIFFSFLNIRMNKEFSKCTWSTIFQSRKSMKRGNTMMIKEKIINAGVSRFQSTNTYLQTRTGFGNGRSGHCNSTLIFIIHAQKHWRHAIVAVYHPLFVYIFIQESKDTARDRRSKLAINLQLVAWTVER